MLRWGQLPTKERVRGKGCGLILDESEWEQMVRVHVDFVPTVSQTCEELFQLLGQRGPDTGPFYAPPSLFYWSRKCRTNEEKKSQRRKKAIGPLESNISEQNKKKTEKRWSYAQSWQSTPFYYSLELVLNELLKGMREVFLDSAVIQPRQW